MISFICADNFLSSWAIISSRVSSTSALTKEEFCERLLDQSVDRVLDFGRGALGARLEILLQQRGKLVGALMFNCLGSTAWCCLGRHVHCLRLIFRLGVIFRFRRSLTRGLSNFS